MERKIKIPLFISLLLFALFILSAIIHNAIFGIFGMEEAVFFIIALLSALAFGIVLVWLIIAFVVICFRKGFRVSGKGMKKSEKIMIKYFIAVLWIMLGLVLNYLRLGRENFASFGSVGNYLIYTGLILIIIITLQALWVKKKLIDERMEFVAVKALRITLLFFIVLSFAVIIIDGIIPITMRYHLFMSYLVCLVLIIYIAAYKILLRFY